MTNTEAKFILRAYRPSGADAESPEFRAALEQAQRDPELRAWLAREQAQDGAVAAKIKSVPIPLSLRGAILTGARLSKVEKPWWQQPAFFAMSASVMLLVSVVTLVKVIRSRDLPQLTAAIVDEAWQGSHHGLKGASANQLVALLQNPATKLSASLGIDLAKFKADGCKTFKVAGHDVMEVCFERGGREFHFYFMPKPSALDMSEGPQFAEHTHMQSVMWTDANHLYVVAGTTGLEALKALL